MYSVAIVVGILFAIALPALAYILGKRASTGASNDDAAALREESQQLEKNLVETLSEVDRFASKAQLESLVEQVAGLRKAITEQQQELQDTAERVEKIKSDVEKRESEQQELRALREEDEAAIGQALTRYSEFSAESLSLEQKLAESLRTVDAMSTEIQMTTDQQAVFAELSNALTQASAQLRDVIIDYQNANDRLSNLSSRFADLESEYSKLIEQQLAG